MEEHGFPVPSKSKSTLKLHVSGESHHPVLSFCDSNHDVGLDSVNFPQRQDSLPGSNMVRGQARSYRMAGASSLEKRDALKFLRFIGLGRCSPRPKPLLLGEEGERPLVKSCLFGFPTGNIPKGECFLMATPACSC